MPPSRRTVLVAAASGAAVLAGLGLAAVAARATTPPPPPLSASAQAFVDDLQSATIIRSTLTLSPNPLSPSRPTFKGVFHIRGDGAIAFDYDFQKRVTFDGQAIWGDSYDSDAPPRIIEKWDHLVIPTNVAFAAIRNGGATWLPNGPHTYGLMTSGAARYDWIELQLPGSNFADLQFFFQVFGGQPKMALVYHKGKQINKVWFHSWDVNPTLSPHAFDRDAPPHDVPKDDAHLRAGGHAL